MKEATVNMKKGILAVCAALALACGGGRDAHSLAFEPDPPTIMVGETLPIQARAADAEGSVDWEVQEMYGGGLLQSQGLHVTYVPPEAAGTYHLVVRSTGRDGRVRKQVLEVRVLASPSVEPPSPRLQPGGSILFRARMRGLPRDAASWAVLESDGGEISAEGRYTAPRKPGIYHVTATSAADPSTFAQATVTVGDN